MATNPRALAKALLAANPTPSNLPVGGGFGGAPATLPNNSLSPMVASYEAWSNGRAAAPGLPRDWATFLAGSFGPLAPIRPVAIDNPPAGSDYPDPRRWSYQTGWNMPLGPPGSEGLKLATFPQLRTIADTYSVARACINVRKQELIGLDWDIIPTKAAEKKLRGDKEGRRDFDERRAKAMRFFRKPDPNYFSFQSWFNAQLEDVLAVDALSLYLHPPRVAGKGAMGSNLAAFELIDGTTIRPLVDVQGASPLPPNPAYQQYIYGVPRVDLMTVMAGEDMADMGKDVYREYSGAQLMYLPYDTRDWTPYGFAPVEKALVPILSGLNRQNYQLEYFSEGSVPGMFISAGDANATPQQIRELQDALNAMAGDPAWKHKIIVLPQGAKIDPQRPASLADAFDEIVMTQVCMAFDVMPMELGISPKVSSSQSSGAANQMAKASQSTHDRKANTPLLKRFMEIYDHVLQIVCEQDDMRFMFEGLEQGDDEQTQVNILISELGHGLRSIDEGRILRGEQPWGLPLTAEPVMMTATGIIPIGALDPTTGQPPQPALPPGPPGGPGAPGGPPPAAGPPAPQAGPAPKPQPARAAASTPAPPAQKINSYAALRELDLIRRRLVKGVPITGWRPEHIPADVFAGIIDVDTLDHAREVVKSFDRRQRRDDAVDAAEHRVTEGLRHLGAGLADGSVPAAQYVDTGVRILRTGIRLGLAAGVVHAESDGLHKGALPAGFESRLHLYGGAVTKAYEQGYGLAVYGRADNPDHIVVRWNARPGACVLCDARSGDGFQISGLPGWPGEGSFGGPICMGGPNCRCSLTYEYMPPPIPSLAAINRPSDPPATISNPSTSPGTTRVGADMAAARTALQSPEPGPAFTSVLDQVADDLAERQRPYLMGMLQDVLAARNDQATAGRVHAAYTRAPDGGHGWIVPAAVISTMIALAIADQVHAQQEAAPATVGAPAQPQPVKADAPLPIGKHQTHDYLIKVGPKGYIHGWIFVGPQAVGARVFHAGHGHGTVTSRKGGKTHVRFDSGKKKSFEHRDPAPGSGKRPDFVPREPDAHQAPADRKPSVKPDAHQAPASKKPSGKDVFDIVDKHTPKKRTSNPPIVEVPELAEHGNQIFGGEFGGLKPTVPKAYVRRDGTLSFAGTIHGPDGREVGEFDRELARDRNGDIYATHQFLQVNGDVQGQKFAELFNSNAEKWYRTAGVSRIQIHANIDVGGYAWARQGYDFADDDERAKVLQRLKTQADDYARRGRTDQAEQATKLLARAKAGEPVTAYEISQVGRPPGAAGKNVMWVGKEAMLNSDWNGVKWLR